MELFAEDPFGPLDAYKFWGGTVCNLNLFVSLLAFKKKNLLIFLKVRITEREGDIHMRERETRGLGEGRLGQAEAKNFIQVFHMSSRSPGTRAISAVFPTPLAGSWSSSGAARQRTNFHMGCKHCWPFVLLWICQLFEIF